MEPRIQYARTSDGVNIAYCSFGSGPPVISVPPIPYSHLLLELADQGYRAWDERLAETSTLIRYDSRGSGLSDREIKDFALEPLILDLEAVADRLRLDKFALFGISQGGSVAIAYAAKHPDRVSHLVLWCPFDGETALPTRTTDALRSTGDWENFTEMVAHIWVAGWDEGQQARQYARLMRESVDPEEAMSGRRSARFPIAHLLPQVACPTLVLQRRDSTYPPLQSGKRIAAGIVDAELVVLEGAALMPYLGDWERIAQIIDRFLGRERSPEAETVSQPATAPSRKAATGGLATILFTDVEGSTVLTNRLGDADARELLREHERITREALKAHGGSEVKTMGDGFMASFGSATSALQCAVAIQRAFDVRARQPRDAAGSPKNSSVASPSRPAAGSPHERDIRVRIGLNAGEPIAEEDPGGRSDLYGTAVIVAARIAAQAQGGEILVSDVVRQLLAGKGFLFNDRGDHALKGFEDPVRVFAVRWREG